MQATTVTPPVAPPCRTVAAPAAGPHRDRPPHVRAGRARMAAGIVLMAALAGCGPSRAARTAQGLYDRGDYAGAAAAADQALPDRPGDLGLWRVRLRTELARGDAAALAALYARYQASLGENDGDLLVDLASATLRQGLSSNAVPVRLAAIRAIETLELEALGDAVIEQMGSDDDRVAAAAAVAVMHGHPQAPKMAESMLDSPDPEARAIAVDGIGRKVGRLAADDLIVASRDRDPRVRAAAVRALAALRDDASAAAVLARVNDPSGEVRVAALAAASQRRLGDTSALASAALADRALPVRLAGVALLRRAGARERLLALRGEADRLVALQAAAAVGVDAGNEPTLAAALADPEPVVRASAVGLAEALVGRATALPHLRVAVADAELGVRLAAARALQYAGEGAAAAPVLTEALAAPAHQLGAAADLARLGDARGLELLSTTLLTDADTRRRDAAVLQHAIARRVTPGLVAALADRTGGVRVAAAALLVELTR